MAETHGATMRLSQSTESLEVVFSELGSDAVSDKALSDDVDPSVNMMDNVDMGKDPEESPEPEGRIRPPCRPFPHDFELQYTASKRPTVVRVASHPAASGEDELVVIFMPGVHGGVGPCRERGQSYDADALFPMVARDITRDLPVSCYRISWRAQGPDLAEAVLGVLLTITHAFRGADGWCDKIVPESNAEEMDTSVASDVCSPRRKHRRVMLVGHSLGGAVALRAAKVLQDIRRSETGGRDELAFSAILSEVEIACIVTFAAQGTGAFGAVEDLVGIPKLFFHGRNDDVLHHGIAKRLHSSSAAPSEVRLVKNCGHDFVPHKVRLGEELRKWVIKKGLASVVRQEVK
eukprot:TRINITY_DN17227_c0_g1_i1.p1 TRINITY_DN17227_c0_g1~~TRINITY_DN17227_c0_g1_i1.p1  ORF type:complete len:369 (-),score=65.77 TRINITY_DN17227_c0_g1_i1:306-1349(-)